MNRADAFAEQMNRLTCLSNSLFGEAVEMDSSEAEALLRVGGIDPESLKSGLYRRLRQQAQARRNGGKSLPKIFTEALDALRPLAPSSQIETEIVRQTKAAVKRVIEKAKSLHLLLEGQDVPAFTMAYRNKKELSPRDKELLDSVTEAQRKRIEKLKGN
jgi:hypothetical protein